MLATKDPAGGSGSGPSSSAQTGNSSQSQSGYENKDPMHIDETLNRIQTQKGVLGVLVTNHEGLVMRSNLDNVQTTQLAALSAQLSTLARHAVRDIDPDNDLKILRIRTKKHEIMISPAKHYILIVVQNPDE